MNAPADAASNIIDDEEGDDIDGDTVRLLASLDPSTLGPQFVERIRELARYKAEHGHCNVPRRYPPNGPLGNCVNKQRQLHRQQQQQQQRSTTNSNSNSNSLTPERKRVLERMGFDWSVDARKATQRRSAQIWTDRYGELKEFQRIHGTCRVPSDHPNRKLAAWVRVQRREYRRLLEKEAGGGGEDGVATSSSSAVLTPERIKLLDAIGFEVASAHDELFELRLGALREYRDRFGDTLVPIGYEDDRGLAQWVSTQRRRYHTLHKTGVRPYGFSDERIAALDDLGFVWNYRQHKADASLDEMAEDWLQANGQ